MDNFKTYKIDLDSDKRQFITCYKCSLKSYNPNDIRFKYCGNCHDFHEPFERKIEVKKQITNIEQFKAQG